MKNVEKRHLYALLGVFESYISFKFTKTVFKNSKNSCKFLAPNMYGMSAFRPLLTLSWEALKCSKVTNFAMNDQILLKVFNITLFRENKIYIYITIDNFLGVCPSFWKLLLQF